MARRKPLDTPSAGPKPVASAVLSEESALGPHWVIGNRPSAWYAYTLCADPNNPTVASASPLSLKYKHHPVTEEPHSMKTPPSLALTLSLLSLLVLPTALQAGIHTKTVDYRDGEAELRGYLVWDDSSEEKRPGIVVVHEWWGLNEYARKRAEMLASMGYAAFAVDMYGKDQVTQHAEEARGWMKQITANVDTWQRRALLGLNLLRDEPMVDTERMGAIGYCFGGATVMQMAYAGANLKGVVSFHGSLPVPTPEQAKQIKGRLLIAHGAADSFIPQERVLAFQKALDDAGARWEMDIFGGAQHGFTNPGAGDYGLKGVRYDEYADRRSWELMATFFSDLFAIE